MNKTEVIAALATKAGLSKKDAEKAVTAFVDTIIEEMKAGNKVQLLGFGTFEAKERAARTARNIKTGASIEIAACKKPAFTAGKALKDAINE